VRHKNGTEAEIQARLRELTDKVRRLRNEMADNARKRPSRHEGISGKAVPPPKRPTND
jgi:hypothetical protein